MGLILLSHKMGPFSTACFLAWDLKFAQDCTSQRCMISHSHAPVESVTVLVLLTARIILPPFLDYIIRYFSTSLRWSQEEV